MHRFRKNRINSELYAWGYNNNGQLGLGDTANRSSPVQVGSLTTWTAIAGGDLHSLALKSDGTLWAWGVGTNGSLGQGDTVSRSSPVQIGSLTTWSSIHFGAEGLHNLALKSDGTLWTWGLNARGQLGLGDTANRSSPVQIGSLDTWSSIATGKYHSFAIKSDGTLWSWGRGIDGGQLGLSAAVDQSSPTQVGALTTWVQVSGGGYHGLAVKSDGTLWAWGNNDSGQLGLADVTARNSPVQIGALTTWVYTAARHGNSAALKSDGTLWTWGYNTQGELGLGDVAKRSSPVQVGSLTNWVAINGGRNHRVVLKSDGTLWVWGDNDSRAQLGLGDINNDRSSPVQVGSLTTWISVGGGRNHTFALSRSEGMRRTA